MMPSPKENELIEKVIEFDQSIETNFRETERELCCERVEILPIFYEKQMEIALLTVLLHHSSEQNNPLSLSLISKSKTKSYLELYGDHLA